ncbi:MAG: glycosyltransferase [Candidatus Latescibacterota bacterium]|nr:MAG: glycosyltransferase [Candidatus Latescibacterota bacterium]
MKILQINKYHYMKGGAERYYFEVSRLLERAGHEVVPFAMRSPRDIPTPHRESFLPEVDYRSDMPWPARARAAARVIWNREAFRAIGDLVDRHHPDVAHLHNIAHQLSGSVVAALAWRGVPTVQTLHDYKLVCPAYRRFRDGRPCDSCHRHRYWEAVRHRCVLGRRSASLVAATESSFYAAIGLYEKGIALYHAPSLFMKETMVRWGIEASRIVHFPYTIDIAARTPAGEDDGTFLFLGRLSGEKGLGVLLDAAARVPQARIRIAGEGPEGEGLEREAAARGLSSIRFEGYLEGDGLARALASCRALLLPSEYDDNSPLVIYEAFAFGKPVIAARRGGMPELVRDGETGILFPAGDGAALADAILALEGDGARARALGRSARAFLEECCGPEAHLEKVLDLYARAIASKAAGREPELENAPRRG